MRCGTGRMGRPPASRRDAGRGVPAVVAGAERFVRGPWRPRPLAGAAAEGRRSPRRRFASPAEVDRLVRQVDDDSCAVRLGAVERLRWLSGSPKLIGPILSRLSSDWPILRFPPTAIVVWIPFRQTVWGHWLTTGRTTWSCRRSRMAQLGRWLDDLARPAERPRPAPGTLRSGRQQIARQELLERLAQGTRARAAQGALQRRLAATTDAGATARLQERLDLCRPAMVAECWMGRRVLGRQHLLVGVPSKPPGAERPSHFDRIDDRVAHCVSGNSLSPGDYPVGVAFPHPKQPGDCSTWSTFPHPGGNWPIPIFARPIRPSSWPPSAAGPSTLPGQEAPARIRARPHAART